MKGRPYTQEQVIYFLLKNINLSSYDKRFLENIVELNLTKNKPVTTNQARLLNKITMVYHKQLGKQEVDTSSLVNLPWKNEPIISTPEYTQAWISLDTESNQIILHSPYKKEFVRKLRDWSLGKWDSTNREWSFPAYEFSLKHLSNIVNEHYNQVNYCDELRPIIEQVKEYEKIHRIWNPTLVYRNGMYYIAATNDSLDDAISHLQLDSEIYTLARLVGYGVHIDTDIIIELDKRLGESENSMALVQFILGVRTVWDQSSFPDLVLAIKMMKPTHVYLAKWLETNRPIFTELSDMLNLANIDNSLIPARDDLDISNEKESYCIVITDTHSKFTWPQTRTNSVGKLVTLVNNQRINIM